MITNGHNSSKQVLNIIANKGFNGRGEYACPYCKMGDLAEDELWHHVPLYHVNDAQTCAIHCPVCNVKKTKNYLLHLRNHHGPVIRGEIPPDREIKEAGIDVDIKGVLKVEHSTYAFDDRKQAYRITGIFYAETSP